MSSLGGPIYAIGGLDDSTCFNNVERYDVECDRWTAIAPMNTPRGGVGSVALMVGGVCRPIHRYRFLTFKVSHTAMFQQHILTPIMMANCKIQYS